VSVVLDLFHSCQPVGLCGLRPVAGAFMDENALREQLSHALDWHEAHVDWKKAVRGIPAKDQGRRPNRAAHSPWELLEHMRIATWDILEFSRDPKHKSPDWPAGYWPKQPEPPNAAAWQKSVKALDRPVDAHTGRVRANNSTRSPVDRRPQRVSSRPACPRPAAAGLLAGKMTGTPAAKSAMALTRSNRACAAP
jgi:hypothetical protein